MLSRVHTFKDFIIEQYIDDIINNIELIYETNNSSYEYDRISTTIHNKSDAITLWEKVLNKVKNLNKSIRFKVLKYFIAIIIGFLSYNEILTLVTDVPIKNDVIEIIEPKIKYIDVSKAKISQSGLEHIKSTEKLKLKVYKLKSGKHSDGKYTVGYGHAEPINNTKLKLGEIISKEKAIEYLKQDIKNAEDGIKRIFNEWHKNDINVNITQNQFDVLVSMAFNMGISQLRKTEFIQLIKKNKMQQAAERIKTTAISDTFSGLSVRREAESNLFSLDLINI